ncbi:PP2C family protein-serine/threonine phosphatase [Micromonospora mirobrigensis]|uniref:Serine phosphatase RsbU, regulator of sigma subunit n=1 Tax=Micromonospora mirobrigensis TaxID=262898 RepID=A0A1C4YT92_9ACTN|nr:PP2C family protein-serine/threonine phosphatase [Micromonospora mirobrigensis]SCF23973.1 Serine phosphatase RsbU, regulator of sigma subunit [Micromonospora mirobrigensis]
MTAADVRDWDPGDGPISTPSALRAPARSAGDPARPAQALPPLAPDRGHCAPDWSEVVEHFREGLIVCDADQVVSHLSPVAERLLPEVAPGVTLAVAGIRELFGGDNPAEFTHRSRRLRVRRVPLSAGRSCWYVEDVTESVTRADALLAERARSAFLAVVGEKLGNPLHPDRAAAAVVRLAVPTLAEVAVLVLAPRSGRARWWRASRSEDEAPTVDSGVLTSAQLPTAIEEGLAGTEPHAVGWLVEQAVDAGWLPGLGTHETSARVVPLPGHDAPAGVLLVARRAVRYYDEADVDLVRAFAARAGAALTTAVLYRDQAEVADTLQASLLPVEPAPASGVQWGTAYRPAQAGLRIGGDFYGSHRLTDGGSVFFLGDVSGKGVEAAVFTGQLRQCLQALHRVESRPVRLLRLLNDALLETTQAHGQGRFATMVLGTVRAHRDGGLTLTMSGGGHLPPLVLRSSGEVEQVGLTGMLVGVVPDPRIGEVTVRLEPGETCLLYSDGVTEARGGRRGDELFGTERLIGALAGCQRMPAPALAERVEQVTCDWLGRGDHDDIAVLALRATGPGARTSRHLHSVPRPPDQRESDE